MHFKKLFILLLLWGLLYINVYQFKFFDSTVQVYCTHNTEYFLSLVKKGINLQLQLGLLCCSSISFCFMYFRTYY
jgi:hypothetical protein